MLPRRSHLAVQMAVFKFMRSILKVLVLSCTEPLTLFNLRLQSDYHPASFKNAHEGPIEDMAFEPLHRRLASVGRGSLQVWIMNDDCKSHRYTALKPS